ncbi:MAG: carbon-nitrogen hydrolase family protein [Gammaproteobacteria bacterium]|nr:carbon-nitrogen hydrolase family protein [Gammaproteobacteria bacterium]
MSREKPIIAALQLASGPQVEANLLQVERLLAEAAAQGARLAVLPETFAFMGRKDDEQFDVAETECNGPIQGFLADMARRHGIWLVGGTLPLRSAHSERLRAACLIFNDKGERVGRYDKIHLFDAELFGDEVYQESRVFEPGDQPLWLDTPFGRMGVAVCYDLRFPELFRRLMSPACDFFALPAAFTEITGKAHWQVLLRARAIENLSYLAAAAQGGYHKSGRQTHGHSMIVDPWGKVLGEAETSPGLVLAALDLDYLQATRKQLPALNNRCRQG